MRWRATTLTIRAAVLAVICAASAAPSSGTTEIVLRSRYRIVLAADSRAIYSSDPSATECKIFEVRDIYSTVSGLARYGRSYRATDSIREGFAGPGTFQQHISATATLLKHRAERLLAALETGDAAEYRYLLQRSNSSSDLVQMAVAQTVSGQPMLGMIELRRTGSGNALTAQTMICPGNCRQDTGLFYMGYFDRIKPYVATSGSTRTVGSAASIDRLIRMEIGAHPAEVGAPINILEVSGSGARWLQNGGNCSLPGVGRSE